MSMLQWSVLLGVLHKAAAFVLLPPAAGPTASSTWVRSTCGSSASSASAWTTYPTCMLRGQAAAVAGAARASPPDRPASTANRRRRPTTLAAGADGCFHASPGRRSGGSGEGGRRKLGGATGRTSTMRKSSTLEQDGVEDNEGVVDFSSVGPPPPAPVVEEEEEEDDGEPDPAKDLAEVVMQAIFEWNMKNDVVDAQRPTVDLDAVVEETYEEAMRLYEYYDQMNEEIAKQEREEAEKAREAEGLPAVVDADLAEDEESGTPYRPPAAVTSIFEPSFEDDEEMPVNLEEPDARTVALARRQEYLYGFRPSDLPREVLDEVEAAGPETRKLAYVRLLAGISSSPYQDNLHLARQLRWAAGVLMPRDNAEGGALSQSVTDEELTAANVLAVKTLVNVTEAYPGASRSATGGWCLWLLKTLRNRDEDEVGHLALDDESVGMFFDLRSQGEKDSKRMKVGSRMFRKALETEVFKMEAGGLMANTTPDQLGEYAAGMGQHILCLAGEMIPSHDRPFNILKDTTREVLDDMATMAYDKVVMSMGNEVSPHSRMVAESCPMTAAEVLKAIAQLAFHIAQPLRYFQTGFSGITTVILQDTMKEMQLLNTAFQENKEFYEVYARDHVISELTNPSPAGTLKMSSRLLRRVMDMYKNDAVSSNILVLSEELSQRLFDADDSLPDIKLSWDNLMWNLEIDDGDYESEKQMKAAMDGVLASLVEKLIEAGMEQPSAKTAQMCATLGLDDEAMRKAFSLVSGDIFEQSLLKMMRSQGTAADGTRTVLFRSDPLTKEELEELMATAVRVGVSGPMALEVVAKELQVSLKNMVVRAGQSMRNNVAKEGAKIIGDANILLDGLCTQLAGAFGATDITETLSIAGTLASLDEYWTSELCFKMVDAVRDPEGARAELGIPGALTSDPEPQWEEEAQRILEILGLKGRR
ncbi:expressed unknown protein [Ectocarpus siliculosus]|uniref:Uncharacterized protein n=1 Tax=Ectocarpus siliculosus TaxID=2880 RepID=D8LHU0_ECTSI|nr:expressed unknown protein [Ectocarpus siliculosus]|eukprot:CBN74371.1 expressed unknown protein [Ectocarpus siliculosus]